MLLLQEVYETSAVNALEDGLTTIGYTNIKTREPDGETAKGSGLMIASMYPIVETAFTKFSKSESFGRLAMGMVMGMGMGMGMVMERMTAMGVSHLNMDTKIMNGAVY